MFSALKFIAAGVIVALFGGFLLAGVLTTQQDGEVAPAAVTESPSPDATSAPTEAPATSVRTDLLPGVDLTVEEVEPGVYRVIDDGVRDLILGRNTDIVAGHDGGIWLLRKNQFVRLGDGDGQPWPTAGGGYDFEVAPDGTVWMVQTPPEEPSTIESFDGEEWTTHHEAIYGATVEVTPDGTVWAVWPNPEDKSRFVFGYLDEDGWQALGGLGWASQLLVASPDDIWAIEFVFMGPDDLVRFVDGAWERLDDLDRPMGAALGPEGTFWGIDYSDPDSLVRFDGSEWSRWPLRDIGFYGAAGVEVATDGSVWYASGSPADTCGGVARFDGVTPDQYLTDLCVEAIDITADGSVWLLANEPDADLRHLYVINPETVAASE